MKNKFLYTLAALITILIANTSWGQDTETEELPYQLEPQDPYPHSQNRPSSNIDLETPGNIKQEVEYDKNTNEYIINNKSGNFNYSAPYSMDLDEYKNYDADKNIKEYWRDRYRSETFETQGSGIPSINIGNKAFTTIFGGSTIDIKAQGSATIRFGVKINKVDNPNQPEDLRRNTTFDFKEEIRMNVVGKVGENLEMQVSYDTESQFDFDNTMKIRYQGNEDDIIQKIEAGDVSLPLTTSLISGSQSLFGILTELKFGNLYVTSVFSQQEGETKTINVEGGAQKTEYELPVVKYDKNRHFFLSHYFRKNYDNALANLPLINSEVNITNIEVWVTNTTRKTENARNILALMDLGEEMHAYSLYDENVIDSAIRNGDLTTNNFTHPDNGANSQYDEITADPDIRSINKVTQIMAEYGYSNGQDFEKVEYARKLKDNEFFVHEKLGYISLNSALNADEVLAVAFEYNAGASLNQVGEFAKNVDSTNAVIVKLLKPSNFNPSLTSWNLMMKNIYSIGAFQVSNEDFIFEVEYYDDETGTKLLNFPDPRKVLEPEFTKEKILRIMNLDNLNSKLEDTPSGDGVFDFVDGAVIRSNNGRVMFPQVEPFGGYLKQVLEENVVKGNPQDVSDKYVFYELYDSTQFKAEQVTSKNKFSLAGSYKSSGGSEIFLNAFNVPKGSVKVTAGGIILQENVDYTVDYNMGRVRITNESFLASGTPIKITLESNNMFSIQSKTLIGTHLDYRFTEDFNIGATLMRLKERPLTEKVNMGDEPISNTIWGLNGSYRTDVPFLTKMVDFIPLIETKEMSSITVEGEFAQLIPGHNDAIGESGNAFIDDFEGSESSIDLRNRSGWLLASTPNSFPEANTYDNLASGFNRAKLAWYQVDPLFFRSGSPVSTEDQSSLLVFRPREQHIFPNKETQNGIPTEISTLDLAFYPKERGPYNYDASPTPNFSAGINSYGELEDPRSRWGGVMRELSTNDFEATNVEYILFWMMDPFVEENSENAGGDLYFNLGNVSEDILKDGRKSYENGLPTDPDGNPDSYTTTAWGRVPAYQTASQDFVNDEGLRSKQDVGLDGLSSSLISSSSSDNYEAEHFKTYIEEVTSIITDNSTALQKIKDDPSNDDYRYFRDGSYSEVQANILERYKDFNNHEGNSPINTGGSFSSSSQNHPDVEDINSDFTLSENESYFQYKVHLKKDQMNVGQNYITDIQEASMTMRDDRPKTVKWYQFKVPVNEFESKYGNIHDFKSIRFMRMYLKGWENNIVLRFARLELVRSEWRKYDYTIKEKTESTGDDDYYDPARIPFSISTVNIEENASRHPVNYVLPPGVDRQTDPSNPQLIQMNEQSLAIRVDSLDDGYSKAIYKTLDMDMRDYKKLQMYVHAEALREEDNLNDDDITCYIRLGSDFTDNYYEYEIPLKITPPWEDRPYDGGNDTERRIVWPDENNVIINFSDLTSAKEKRNDERRSGANSTVSLLTPFVYEMTEGKRIVVKGNPSLSNVKTIMIGIKNPLAKYNQLPDDAETKSAEIWVNELRLTDFKNEGGWAATGRINTRLADFGNISVAGSTMKAGFGGIEQKAQERSKDETNQIDVSANFEMGKFFPEKAKVRIPMHMAYSRTAINPMYNPLDQDIILENTLNNPNISESEKEDIINKAQDLTERKSINFTNVGVGKITKGKTQFYDPSNVSASYAYSEMNHRDVGVAYDVTRNHSGGINYVFNNKAKNVQPFKNNKVLKKPALRLIGDFNFYYAPSQVSLSTTMDKRYSETLLRNLDNQQQTYTPTYDKSFDWNRKSSIKHNFSKSLKCDFSTNTNATIKEMDGIIDKSDKDKWEQYKDTIWNSIMNLGTPDNYNHVFNASYAVPIKKIPGLEWVSLNARYAATYNWDRAKGVQVKEDSLYMGNTIKNSQKISLNSQFNMNTLYNKVDYIKDIDKKYKQSRKQRKKPRFETKEVSETVSKLKANIVKRISHNLNTEEEIVVKVISKDGAEVPSTFEIISMNKIAVTVKEEYEDATVKVSGKVEVKDNPLKVTLEHIVLATTGFKQISGTVSKTRGTILSGYKQDHRFGSLPSDPGIGFVFGMQDKNFAAEQGSNSNLITNSNLIQPYVMTDNLNLNLKAKYQPVRSLRVDFSVMRKTTGKKSEYYYIANENTEQFDAYNYQYTGSYSTNVWMLSSAFSTPNKDNTSSSKANEYQQNLIKVAWRLADERLNASGNIDDESKRYTYDPTNGGEISRDEMPEGYNSTSPDIAIPAFLAAYTNQDVSSMNLNYLKNWSIIRPSWRVKYDGLKNYPIISKYFKNVTFSHGYNSTFTVGSMKSNSRYDFDEAFSGDFEFMSWERDEINDSVFIAKYDVGSFSVAEKFLPLIGVDMTWKNNVLTKFEFKKSRNITVNLANNQMLEVYSQEWVIGSGYRFNKVPLRIGEKNMESDVNLRADLSIRDNLSISRNLSEGFDDITAGQKTVALNITADYQMSDKLTFRTYFKHNLTNPVISSSYKTTDTQFGFEFRFSLAQ